MLRNLLRRKLCNNLEISQERLTFALFLKNKSLIVALNFYDLLGQQSNYERWVNATGRSDTQYNSVNSYAMLHVRYRLNIFGGKIDTEGRYDKKWGSRDNQNRQGRR